MRPVAAALLLAAVAMAGCAGSGGSGHRTTSATSRPVPALRPLTQLARNLTLTRAVPCPGRTRRVGPAQLKLLTPVTAVTCVDGLRRYPGRGQWEISIRRIAVSSVSGLQRYFEQPNKLNVPKNGLCLTVLEGIAPVAFVDATGRWLVPRTPVDGCNHPLGFAGYGKGATRVRWHVVSVRRIRRIGSATGS